jgi:DedD protein
MNDGLKQRIVGALVLIALGVIFVPVLFDRERIAPVDRNTLIPPEPDIAVLPLPEPPTPTSASQVMTDRVADGQFAIEETSQSQEVVVEDASQRESVPDETVSGKKVSDETVSGKTAPKEIKPEEKVLHKAWVLQVASFSSRERAEDMLKKIEKTGLRGFIRDVSSEFGKHTRVYAGPSIRKSDMESAKLKLDKKFGLNSMVLNYKP